MNLLSAIAEVFFPRECCGCGEILADEEPYVCSACLSKVQLTEEAWHRGNSLEQLFKGYSPYQKEHCPGDKFVRGAAYSYYRKGTPIRDICHQMKFRKYAGLGEWMGRHAAEHMLSSGFFDGIDLIIPIALHDERLKERGFNQSEMIAQGISSVTGIAVDCSHLVRTVNTAQQSMKTFDERKELADIFSVENPEGLRHKHVLVVDDIITSGSTMARALEVLHPIAGCSYSVFSLSYAKH